MRASVPTRRLRYAGVLLSLCLLVSGCSLFSGGTKIHKSARGSVYLKEVADWSFEAGHPAVLDQTTIFKVVKGIVVDESTKASTKVPASGSKPMRIFSDEDAEFLAPLLAQALSQARPEQIVGFTVSPSAGSGAEPAAGTLYVQQSSIYLTLAPSQSRKVSGFMPAAAARIEKAPSYAAGSAGEAFSLVIDYQALAKAPMPAATPLAAESKPLPVSPAPVAVGAKTPSKQDTSEAVPTPAAALSAAGNPASSEMSNDELLSRKLDELRQARESNKMKESEIGLLKKEIDWLKQELRERTAEVKGLKADKVSRSAAPKKKTAEARPSH